MREEQREFVKGEEVFGVREVVEKGSAFKREGASHEKRSATGCLKKKAVFVVSGI